MPPYENRINESEKLAHAERYITAGVQSYPGQNNTIIWVPAFYMHSQSIHSGNKGIGIFIEHLHLIIPWKK